MLTIGFTAGRMVLPGGRLAVLSVLHSRVPYADRYVTGGCRGGDAVIGRFLAEYRPDSGHVVLVPGNQSQISPWWDEGYDNVQVIRMPAGSDYRYRNESICGQSDLIWAFPSYPEDDSRSQRSGTWQTARMARNAGKLAEWHCIGGEPFAGHIEYSDGVPVSVLMRGRVHW